MLRRTLGQSRWITRAGKLYTTIARNPIVARAEKPFHDPRLSIQLGRAFSNRAVLAMPFISLGRHFELSNGRYTVTLSTGKRLVLFRLPIIASNQPVSRHERRRNESDDGWLYYAMEAECPHAGGPMGDAQVDIEDSAYVASCPWHAYDFNVETGESSYGIKACTFPVILDDAEVKLEINGTENLRFASITPISEKVKFKHGPRPATTDDSDTTTNLSNVTLNPVLGTDATVCDWCVSILNTSDPERKIEMTTQLFSMFATRESSNNPMQLGAGTVAPPEEPPRGDLKQLEPWKMPNQGRGGSLRSRITMLHALANIEQWAIDLAIDICVRFATFQTLTPDAALSQPLPRTFYYDWLKVANDEAKHFSLLRSRLEEMGSHFGALPVHHGLWESATRTAHDLRARISIIALVHEARGLDVNPMTIEKFRKGGDAESVETLSIIHNDEITHVTTGHRWLTWICEQEGTDPVQVFRGNVLKYFKGAVKGPFNANDRAQAGLDQAYYENLAGSPWADHVIAGG